MLPMVRKLGAIATVAMTVMLADCTSSTAPSPKSSFLPMGSAATLVTATATISRLVQESAPWRSVPREGVLETF